VVALELRRSDIGFGRVLVDDVGVTRHYALRTASIAWDEIRGARYEVLYLVRWIDMALVANDIRRGYRGDHRLRFGIVLLGDGRRVAFNVKARDEKEEIGRGTHERMVIDIRRLGERLSVKSKT